jgi:plastocyanin
MRFIADQIHIRAGDTVEWINQDPVTPHTVTFGAEPQNLVPPSGGDVEPDADGAPHAHINFLGENVHSGLIFAARQDQTGDAQTPLGPTRFRVTFNIVGTFPYKCSLHDILGMTGMVMVFSKVPPQ